MTRLRRRNLYCRVLLVMLTPILLAAAQPVWGAALIYKNYLIRSDGPQDVLCEPHVVQHGEYLLKIFQNKGEIAPRAFPEFLRIFKRLNPQIEDIDKLEPGDVVLIPLKIISPDQHKSQASDIVTIPFVTLSRNIALIQQFAKAYKVQPGDYISKLVVKDFGRYESRSYQQGLKLFKLLNQDIHDLNRIEVGQTVTRVDPAIRRQPWFADLFNPPAQPFPGTISRGPAVTKPSGTLRPFQNRPMPQRFLIEQLAMLPDARLKTKTRYYFPDENRGDFAVDLRQNPMLYLNGRPRILFTAQKLAPWQEAALQRAFKGLAIVALDLPGTARQKTSALAEAILRHLGAKPAALSLTRNFDGVVWKIKPQWVLPSSSDKTADNTATSVPSATPTSTIDTVSLVENTAQKTPMSMVDYLSRHGINLYEIVLHNDLQADDATSGNLDPSAWFKQDAASDADASVALQDVLASLGYHFTPHASIHFPYAGVQITARANLITAHNMPPLFVDFGDLYGEALMAIEKAGFHILHFGRYDPPQEILKTLLKSLKIAFTRNPSFRIAQRPPKFNTLFTITGFLLSQTKPEKILLTLAPLQKPLKTFLKRQGITVYTVRLPL